MVRVWWVGLMVLGACSFDASGLGRGPGQTTNTTEATGTGTGTDTTTGGLPTTGGPTTMQTGDDSGTATTQDVTITSGSSSSGDPSTGTSTGIDPGTGTSTGTSTSGVDGGQTGFESDVDCGGADCPACADGEQCVGGADCVSLHCELGTCVAPSCVDGIENGDETDLDCAVGEGCDVDGDCISGICGPGVCVATACENFKQDGLETGIDCGDVCPACVAPVINEIDYDQEIVDDAEFVELYNPGPSPIALAGLRLVLVDGATKIPYTTVELGPAGVLMPGGFLVVRTPGLVVAPGALTLDFGLAQDNIQNGAPDGVAVVDSVQPALFDALSYEGSIVDANIPPLGVVSLVEGVATPGLDDGFTSMVRFPDGLDSDDAFSDWVTSGTPTPGAPNVL